jgi:hypothetical protein
LATVKDEVDAAQYTCPFWDKSIITATLEVKAERVMLSILGTTFQLSSFPAVGWRDGW